MQNQNNNNNQNNQAQQLRAELAKAKQELAKYTKLSEILKGTLKDFTIKANSLTKDQLDEAYDPADPASVQKAIDAHTQKLQQEMETLFNTIDQEADKYVQETFRQKDLTLEDKLAVFNEANKAQLTAEQLENDIPPRILKQYKDNEEELFKAATEYLAKTSGTTQQPNQPHNPQPPHTPTGTNVPATGDDTGDEGDEDDEMY